MCTNRLQSCLCMCLFVCLFISELNLFLHGKRPSHQTSLLPWRWASGDNVDVPRETRCINTHDSLKQGCPVMLLEGTVLQSSAPAPIKHLKQPIKLWLGLLETSRQVCRGELELNSAGLSLTLKESHTIAVCEEKTKMYKVNHFFKRSWIFKHNASLNTSYDVNNDNISKYKCCVEHSISGFIGQNNLAFSD